MSFLCCSSESSARVRNIPLHRRSQIPHPRKYARMHTQTIISEYYRQPSLLTLTLLEVSADML